MRDLLPIVIFSNFLHNTFCILHLTPRVLLAEGCDSPYLLGFLVELLQWRLEGEQDDAQVSFKSLIPEKSDQISISKNIMTGMTIRWF